MPIEHLPENWRPAARRFRDWYATDSGILLTLALVFLGRAVSYLGEAPRLMQHAFEINAGWVSPALWTLGVILLLGGAFSTNQQIERVALCYAVALCALWATMYFFTDPIPIPHDWGWFNWARVMLEHTMNFLLRGIMYAGLAVVAWHEVWRGRAGTVRMRGAHE